MISAKIARERSATLYVTRSLSMLNSVGFPVLENLLPCTRHISSYLDRPVVRAQLGVDPVVTANFSSCSNDVGAAFASNLDGFRPTYHYVAALLERGVRALIYVGKNDWICNHVGNEAWTRALEWSGHEAFSKQALRAWNVSGTQAGQVRSAQGLTFATIEGAGHMVRFAWESSLIAACGLTVSNPRFRMINLKKAWKW